MTEARLLIYVAVAALTVCLATAFWVFYWRKPLSFFDITDDEQEQYVSRVNKIDALLTRRFLRKLPVRIALAFFTLGLGLMISSIAYGEARKENRDARKAARNYVRSLKWRYQCHRTSWKTFPGCQILLPLPRFPVSGFKCPVCGRHRMKRVNVGRRQMRHCRNCGKTIILSNSGSSAVTEILVPGLCAHAIRYYGDPDNISDLAHTLSDALGSALDIVSLFDFF